MNYGYGKTFHLKDGFTALNGCVQYYKVTFGNDVVLVASAPADPKKPTLAEVKDIMAAQANYLRALEVLRTYGGQPIITKVAAHELEFTLEQANVYGKNAPQQVSAKYAENGAVEGVSTEDFHFQAEAVEKIEELFANIKTVALKIADGFDGAALADGVELAKAIVEDEAGAKPFAIAENGVEVKEVLF